MNEDGPLQPNVNDALKSSWRQKQKHRIYTEYLKGDENIDLLEGYASALNALDELEDRLARLHKR